MAYYIGGGTSYKGLDKSNRFIVDESFNPKNTEDLLRKFVYEITESLTSKLTALNKDQPGDLIQSIGENSTVTSEGTKLSLKIALNDYWKFVDEGVDGTLKSQGSQFKYKKNGKRIPLEATKSFIAARGLSPSMSISAHKKSESFKDKRIKKQSKQVNKKNALDSFAWAIGANIKKYGIKPTHFFTDVVNAELKARLTAELSKSLLRDIELEFTQ